jgi:site-specific DNA-methyltransferase (adenine-specific)
MDLDVVYNEDFLKSDKIENGSIDLILTSPPYFNAKDYSSWETYKDYLLFAENFLNKSFNLLKNSGRIAINIPDGYGRNPCLPVYADYCKIMQKIGFILRGSIVWHKLNGGGKTSWGSWRSSSNPCLIDEHEMIIVAHKINPRIENSCKMSKEEFLESIHSVWQIKPETGRKWKHPAPYPIEIPTRLIRFLSGRDSIVLDPFIGSGTTAVACKNLGRRYIGFEVVEKYYKNTLRRLSELKQKEQ